MQTRFFIPQISKADPQIPLTGTTLDEPTGIFQALGVVILTLILSECACLFLIQLISSITWNSFYTNFPSELSVLMSDVSDEDYKDQDPIPVDDEVLNDALITSKWIPLCGDCSHGESAKDDVGIDGCNDDDEKCAICLSMYVENDSVSRSKFCKHQFHTSCYKQWLSRHHTTCPYCRCNVLASSSTLKSNENYNAYES